MLYRPPDYQLLPVPHIQQTDAGECLTACAAMICAYLQIDISYTRLVKALQIQPGFGVPLSKIERLKQLRITAAFRRNSNIQHLYTLLDMGWPTIVGVQTAELPHWDYMPSQHAVVVVGMDHDHVYINDPEMPAAPTPVSMGDFDLAWDEHGHCFAILAP